ncbi:hypothetical protein [Breoghania sp. L-A4]|uniref:hypothetical protein n=1 Tax=Breoghania sp. L-A4 TaxID=2304600 RepID=UPI000E35B935|nr:hypothetical protein [Breoghania sp. L-A4]AXS39696.1 hypothetical protein D1F64_06095 [Breoghania sp. L-A4]
MATAKLNLQVQPYRMLKKSEAASYCGLPAAKLATVCPVAPVQFPGGALLWDVRDLDAWLESLKTGAADSDDAILGRLDPS